MDEPSSDPIVALLMNYKQLNRAVLDELAEEPSPLEFMRYVARNAPFVVRGGASHWEACRKWDYEYLVKNVEWEVNVAVTPRGNADAPALLDGELVFAKPHEEDQDFESFLSYVVDQERQVLGDEEDQRSEVRYAQTQNDNLRQEYSALLADVQRDIPFARIALRQGPEAINLWIGNSRSVTALHCDYYENIYVQILGRKHFVLLPPAYQPCVAELQLRQATYGRWEDQAAEMRKERDEGIQKGEEGGAQEAGDGEGESARDGDFVLKLDKPEGDADEDWPAESRLPFVTWDPDDPDVNATKYSHLARPLRVTLEPGDMLYLPAMWYHKVSQSSVPGGEGFVVAVNYWYLHAANFPVLHLPAPFPD